MCLAAVFLWQIFSHQIWWRGFSANPGQSIFGSVCSHSAWCGERFKSQRTADRSPHRFPVEGQSRIFFYHKRGSQRWIQEFSNREGGASGESGDGNPPRGPSGKAPVEVWVRSTWAERQNFPLIAPFACSVWVAMSPEDESECENSVHCFLPFPVVKFRI